MGEISDRHVEELSAVDHGDYWWYAVRRAHVDGLLAGIGEMDYLDFGCGTGGVLAHVREAFSPRRALGLDGTEQAVAIAAERGLGVRLADFRRVPADLHSVAKQTPFRIAFGVDFGGPKPPKIG